MENRQKNNSQFHFAVRRRRLSFGKDDFLASVKKSAGNVSDFGRKSDFGDENPEMESANNNVVGGISDEATECPNLLVSISYYVIS